MEKGSPVWCHWIFPQHLHTYTDILSDKIKCKPKQFVYQVVCVINMHNMHNTPFYNNAHIKTDTLSLSRRPSGKGQHEHRQVRRDCASKFPLRAITFQNTWAVTLTLTWNHYTVIRILPIVIIILTCFVLVLALTLLYMPVLLLIVLSVIVMPDDMYKNVL